MSETVKAIIPCPECPTNRKGDCFVLPDGFYQTYHGHTGARVVTLTYQSGAITGDPAYRTRRRLVGAWEDGEDQ